MKVYVVIPIFNNWELTHNLLWNLYRKERKEIEEVIVVDDSSTDEEVAYGLNWWQASWKTQTDPLPIKVITTETNMGFLRAANLGLQAVAKVAEADDVIILLSNDVQIHSKFVSQIKDILKDNPKSLVGGILYTHDTGWNTFNGKVFPYLEGWLLATTSLNWEMLGYFDPQYAPNDFEDVDLSTKALTDGYELIPLNNVGLQHMGGQSIHYGDERLAQTNRNKKLFEEKWITK